MMFMENTSLCAHIFLFCNEASLPYRICMVSNAYFLITWKEQAFQMWYFWRMSAFAYIFRNSWKTQIFKMWNMWKLLAFACIFFYFTKVKSLLDVLLGKILTLENMFSFFITTQVFPMWYLGRWLPLKTYFLITWKKKVFQKMCVIIVEKVSLWRHIFAPPNFWKMARELNFKLTLKKSGFLSYGFFFIVAITHLAH